jgi:hypothetical protein
LIALAAKEHRACIWVPSDTGALQRGRCAGLNLRPAATPNPRVAKPLAGAINASEEQHATQRVAAKRVLCPSRGPALLHLDRHEVHRIDAPPCIERPHVTQQTVCAAPTKHVDVITDRRERVAAACGDHLARLLVSLRPASADHHRPKQRDPRVRARSQRGNQ